MSVEQAMRPVPLAAGPVSAVFEPDSAFLRYVQVDEREMIRGVYAAVRDHNWGTVPIAVGDLTHRQDDEGFELAFTAHHRQGEIDFTWAGRIVGAADGTITYTFDGQANTSFKRNRIGFCVLHPRDATGARCRVTRVDGSQVEDRFPELISPHQPFLDMRAIEHEAAEGLWCRVVMEGETFEMEDQRNWIDASFKTYCTPLALPFPVDVSAGDRVQQKVTIEPIVDRAARPAASAPTADRVVELAVDEASTHRLPRLGLELTPGHEHTPAELERLRPLKPAHVRAELRLDAPDWRTHLEHAAQTATQLNARLELASFFSPSHDAELASLGEALRELATPLARVIVLHREHKTTPDDLARAAGEVLGERANCFVGTDAFFTELNREPPNVRAATGLAGVAFSTNPQVHAFDDASLIETLEAQTDVVRTARSLAAGGQVAVSPVTLKMRWNPNATAPPAPTPPGELPADVDGRQREPITAVWTLGSVKYLAEAGADSVTYYRTVGLRGVMEREAGSEVPAKWPSQPLERYPVYDALALLAGAGDAQVVRCTSDAPLRAIGLALRQGATRRLLLMNLTHQRQRVRVTSTGQAHTLEPMQILEASY